MSYSQAIEGRLKIASILNDPRGRRLLTEAFGSAIEEGRYNQGTENLFEDGSVFHRMYHGACHGDPFYWAPNMCEMLEAVAPGIPDVRLFEELAPCHAGLFWFAQPLSLPLWDDTRSDLAAIGWHRAMDEEGQRRIDATFFTNAYDIPGFPPFPSNLVGWEFGALMSEGLRAVDEIGAKVLYRERYDAMFRYMAAAFSLMNQTIVITSDEPVTRATRKRAAAALKTPQSSVRVVKLRRPEHQTKDSGTGPAEWSCQWVVRGHWRQQYHPSTGDHRPLFILPYVKGPEDKPLKVPAERVFAIVR